MVHFLHVIKLVANMYVSAVVPARFLIIIAHLMLTIIIIWDRNSNVISCLPLTYSQSQYHDLDVQIIVATSITFFLLAIELVACIFALSISIQWQNFLSVLFHSAAALTLSYYIFDNWCSSTYWYVFGFCCVPPAIIELFIWIIVWIVKKES